MCPKESLSLARGGGQAAAAAAAAAWNSWSRTVLSRGKVLVSHPYIWAISVHGSFTRLRGG